MNRKFIHSVMSCVHCAMRFSVACVGRDLWLLWPANPEAVPMAEAASMPVCVACGGALVVDVSLAVTTETGKTLNVEQGGAVAVVEGVASN